MKEVGKYNLFKALSTFITTVPTILVAFLFKDSIVYDTNASVSFAAMIGIICALLFFKNKIAENFKLPSPFIIASILFIVIIMIENILIPTKYICLTVMIVCGIDELLFKRIYERIEMLLPEKRNIYKHFGFYICKTETITGEIKEEVTNE